jgi:hypothetical protein
MTAIVSVYTPDGFIVGADGLRMNSSGTVVSETAQKLFPFQSKDTQLLYSWCGTTQFYDRDGACIFDFISQSEPLLTAAILYAHADFAAFLQFVKAGLYVLLRQSRLIKRGDSFQINLNSELARMLITGYFKGEPCMADIGIDLENGVLVPPVIRRVNLPLHGLRDVFSGSKKAFEPFEDIYPINREEAISFVCDYIQACINGPDPGQAYGGRIHVAELTPVGFAWVKCPASS